MFNQDLGKLAAPRASTTRRCARYVLRRLMIDRTTISAIAAELGVSWHTVSSIAMPEVPETNDVRGISRRDLMARTALIGAGVTAGPLLLAARYRRSSSTSVWTFWRPTGSESPCTHRCMLTRPGR